MSDTAVNDPEAEFYVQGPTLSRVGPLTKDQIAALVKHGQLRETDRVWLQGTLDPVDVSSLKPGFTPKQLPPGFHDTVLAVLPQSISARLPKNAERRRGLVKGALDAVPDFFMGLVFLAAWVFGGSLRADAGYIAAIEAVAVWGGFFLDATYGSGRKRSQRILFGGAFLLYYGGIILGIAVLGTTSAWPALYAGISLLQRMPGIVRRMRPGQQRVALEIVIRSLGGLACAILLFVVGFMAATWTGILAGQTPSETLPWAVFMCVYLTGQGMRKVLTGIFGKEINAYVDYTVAYNMMGRTGSRNQD